jgi:hypothetical protein
MPEIIAIAGAFPIERDERYLTRANRMEDATEYRSPERQTPLFRWQLNLAGMDAAQVQALEAKFNALSGPYGTFVFLDPLENLLLWSEDFSQAAWIQSPPFAFSITGGYPDPLGGNAARLLVNAGGSVGALAQIIAAPPAALPFTGSIWLRSAGGGTAATLSATDAAGESVAAGVAVTTEWKRFTTGGTFSAGNASGQVGLRVELPAGAAIYAFGAQLMALPGPAAYARTAAISGFHPRCRLASDLFSHRLEGFGCHSLPLTIMELA